MIGIVVEIGEFYTKCYLRLPDRDETVSIPNAYFRGYYAIGSFVDVTFDKDIVVTILDVEPEYPVKRDTTKTLRLV